MTDGIHSSLNESEGISVTKLLLDPAIMMAAYGAVVSVMLLLTRDIMPISGAIAGSILAFGILGGLFRGSAGGSGSGSGKNDPGGEENQRLRKATENAKTNIMIADANMTIVYLNKSMVEMFQNAAGDIRKDLPSFDPNNLIGQNPDIFHKSPVHQRRMIDQLTHTYSTEISVGGRIFGLTASPIHGDDSKRIGTIVEWQDLTDQRAGEIREAALLAELKAVDRAQARIAFTPEGEILDANENFLKAMGYKLEEIVGKHHRIFCTEELKSSQDYRNFWAEIRRGHFQAGEFHRLSKEGDDVYILATYNPVLNENGEVVKVVKYASDVTETAMARIDGEQERQRIATENTRIKSALDVCTTNVMVADADRNIVYINHSVGAMLQKVESEIRKDLPHFNASKIIGQNIDGFHKNPAHQISLLERMLGTYETGITIGANHFKLIANPVSDENGERIGYVVEWADVTNERRIEAEIAQVVAAVPAGDFEKRISIEGLDGFWLTLGNGLNTICDVLSTSFEEFAVVLSHLARGDLTYRIERDYEGTLAKIKDDFHTTFDRLTDIVTSIQTGAQEVTSASTEIAAGSLDLSQRTETQAASIEQTASAMEEISTTVSTNADSAEQANVLGKKTRDVADTGGNVVQKAVLAMSAIEQSSQKISDIIGVIDEIAFQTNLLALNAAVEAARAGDAGKGFAVVATEVRNLAQRSSDAAKNIKELIVDSNNQVESGVQLVNKTGESLGEIVTSIQELTNIIADIASASREQSTGLSEINTAIANMDEMTQQNSALVEENTASARSLEEQAQVMLNELTFFSLDNSIVSPVATISSAKGHAHGRKAVKQVRPKAIPAPSSQDDWAEF